MSFLIRPARESDVPGISEGELTVGRTSLAAAGRFGEGISAAIRDSHRLVLVAEAPPDMPRDGGSAVVGWSKTHYWDYSDGHAPAGHYLGGITVAPHFRRQGVAAALTEARLEWIWERADTAWYVVNSRNQASLALHQRWGFEEVARGPGFHTVTFDGGEGLLLKASRPMA
ncbi:GNAT family N-acetyltransferase [Paenarthrobacter sp. 2TAF44]|uniref:GNAT family N-acetyltransferase n=1 Tax=Paenarthrobacter sp. 2TAF44 TaxID=3233018 RepID=UPI003F9B009F